MCCFVLMLLYSLCIICTVVASPRRLVLFTQTATWAEARNVCRENGGELASATSERQNRDMLEAAQAALTTFSLAWIGARDETQVSLCSACYYL